MEGEATLTHFIEESDANIIVQQPLKPLKVQMQSKYCQQKRLNQQQQVVTEVARELHVRSKMIEEFGLRANNATVLFNIVKVSRHGFVGLDGLFRDQANRFGAFVSSQHMLCLRFTFPKKRLRKVLRILFKSETFKNAQLQIKKRYESALEAQLAIHKSRAMFQTV